MAGPWFERFDLHRAPLDEGTVLLEASAGTGKTYTLTGILVRMLLEGAVPSVDQALVVTFTVAAADELKNRLRDALQRAHRVCLGGADEDAFFQGLARFGKKGATSLRRALDEFDQASVMTIHGFCKRLLDESAFESDQPFELDFAVDEAPLWQAAAADALRLLHSHDSPMLGAVQHEAELDPEALVQLYRNWQRYPDVALEPAEPQLGVRLANLKAAVHQAAAQWDDQILAYVAEFSWLSNKRPTPGDQLAYFRQRSQSMALAPEWSLSLFDKLAESRLRSELKKTGRPRLEQPFFATCDEVRSEWRQTVDHLRTFLLLRMHERLARHKRERSVLTFDDLLARTHQAITDPERQKSLLQALRKRYSVALIDEFQDTDARQYEILARCFSNRPLFLVGDPKQSIYAFRGADLRTYLAAADDAVQKNTLAVNFRSSPQLVAAVNQLFARPGSFVEPDIRMHKVQANAGPDELQIEGDDGPALRFRVFSYAEKKGIAVQLPPDDTRKRIASDVTSEIRRLLDGAARIGKGKVLPRHIAVLTRRNVEAVLVQEHLRDAGIVSVIGKAGDVFETDELIELERVLLAIQRPNDLMRARAAMTTRVWGYDARTLAALDHDEQHLERELNRLESWRQLWIHKGFVVMKEQLLQDLDVHGRMLERPDGERRLTNLQQLCEMLHQAEHDHRLSPEGLLHWLRNERSHKDEIDYQRRELRLESDEDAVQILTMHGSKGLQYEIVFCPFLWDGRAAQTKNTALDAERSDAGERGEIARRFAFEVETDDPGWLRAESDRIAEDCRLAYVALTRAKRRCYVHWGPIGYTAGGYWRSALAWLLHPQGVDQHKASWPETWGKEYRNRSASLRQDLERVASLAAPGAIGIEAVPDTTPPVSAADVQHAAMLHATEILDRETLDRETPDRETLDTHEPGDGHTGSRHPNEQGPRKAAARPQRRSLPWRRPLVVHSFSSLVAGGAQHGSAHDTLDPASSGADQEAAAPSGTPNHQEAGSGIFGFARGAEAGLCLHTILETVDLHALDGAAAAASVRTTLAHHGLLDPDAHPGDIDPAATVQQNLHDLAAARMCEDGPAVLEACGHGRLVEWKFTLPIGRPDLQALARCFAESGHAPAVRYAERLRHLAHQHFAGFLTGFVDLIAEHDGRYWVVDWKSNHLGNAVEDYGPEALQLAMHGHDYVLQYHLYVLAWHRHLRTRLPDYDYDRHFAGVSYAFLRGATPGETSGMFYDRPPRELVEAMDAWARGERS